MYMAPIGAFIRVCPSGVVLYSVYYMAIKAKRFGGAQFFARTSAKEDNRYAGTQLGIVTYDKDENYHVSYLELGVRCDHFVEPIVRRGPTGGTYTNASSPLEYDADLIRPRTQSVPVDSDKQEATA